MKAILFDQPGAPEVLYIGEYPSPKPGAGEIRVQVHATALNRADLLQRQGKYPPPAGESPLLGLEMAGTVAEVGAGVTTFTPGDAVCALLGGGGYAQEVVIPAEMAMPLPANFSFTKAAAIPEAFLTAHQALHWLAELQPGESVLIHAGASGVGVAAIQLARLAGANPIIATASAGKHDLCRRLGAQVVIDYRNEDFAVLGRQHTHSRGVDVVVDFVGAPNFARNLDVLAPDGRMVMLAFLGGAQATAVDLRPILAKRLRIMGSTLRNRSEAYKMALTADFQRRYWPHFDTGELQVVVDSIYDWHDVAAAHHYMEGNHNQGKIVLSIGE